MVVSILQLLACDGTSVARTLDCDCQSWHFETGEGLGERILVQGGPCTNLVDAAIYLQRKMSAGESIARKR